MRLLLILLIFTFLTTLIALSFMRVEKRVLYAPSIEVVNNVVDLGGREFLVAGNTKSFTETSDDWIFLMVNPNFEVSKFSILSGSFSDRLVNVSKVGDKILAIGDTWSFRRESLDDVLVSFLGSNMELLGYYVVSGIRDDRASRVVPFGNQFYFLGSTRSVGFGANSTLIYRIGDDFYPTSFWVIGSAADQEPFDLIQLSSDKALLVSKYQKMSGNIDCLLSVVDANFNISRSFAFGGGFDDNIVDIIKEKDNFYFIFETRSFKPQDKTNILISVYKRSNLSHVRSFSFGTLEEEDYLSAYKQGENIFIFFSTSINKKPVLAVAILDDKLALKAVYNINNLFGIDSKVSGLGKLENDFWAVNLFNLNTLEDMALFKTDNIFDYLIRDPKRVSKSLESMKTEKYYLKIAKYPNIESYPVEIKSQQISSDNFIITNEINLNYMDIQYQDLWK
ncbi:MAG: hypothetical protein NZM44_01140 [Candidatus Calescibacterium sp.]|nr:hypothetical protein [Candidatus Calescibacterium sp.]